MTQRDGRFRTVVFTIFALLAFAANSLLCRSALGEPSIDAASFTSIRLLSGAVALWIIGRLLTPGGSPRASGSWRSAFALFLYAAGFSFSYLSLSAGTGALLLFGAVQATMIGAGLLGGERPHPAQWIGLLIAIGGLAFLVFPGLSAPSPLGAALMVVAGVAWGVYSLRGRGVGDPTAVTADNFRRAVPFAAGVTLATLSDAHVSPTGAWLAGLSGALASGVGYVLWYAALRGLTATRAATVQFSVPILVALGAVIVLDEPVSLRLVVATVLIIGGVALTLMGRESTIASRGRGGRR